MSLIGNQNQNHHQQYSHQAQLTERERSKVVKLHKDQFKYKFLSSHKSRKEARQRKKGRHSLVSSCKKKLERRREIIRVLANWNPRFRMIMMMIMMMKIRLMMMMVSSFLTKNLFSAAYFLCLKPFSLKHFDYYHRQFGFFCSLCLAKFSLVIL